MFLFLVCTEEHVLGVINLLTSLGRMWVSFHHCFIVLGHVSCSYCMVLLLGKPAFLSDYSLTGSPLLFSFTYDTLVGLTI